MIYTLLRNIHRYALVSKISTETHFSRKLIVLETITLTIL